MPIFYLDSGSIENLEVSSSLLISGSFTVSGSMRTTQGLTGSLFGTASWANNAVSSSFATSASFARTASFVNTLFQDVDIVSGALTVDVASITDSLAVGGFIGNQNNYIELYAQNLNSGVSASTDIVAYANNGTDTSSFIYMGINGTNTPIGYSFGNGNDAYVYNTGGNLFIGNNTAFFQPLVSQQSLFLFANASGSPDLAITGSRVGIQKTGSLNATLDVSGSVAVTGSLRVSSGITGSLFGTASFAVSASWAPGGGGGLSGGRTNAVPLWTSATTLGNSFISQSGNGLYTVNDSNQTTGFDFNFFTGDYRFGNITLGNILHISLGNIRVVQDGQGFTSDGLSHTIGDYNNVGGSTKITVNDTTRRVSISGSVDLSGATGFASITAGEALLAGDLVSIQNGFVVKASSDTLTKPAHGFVREAVSNGAQAIIYYSGLNTSLSGLTAGTRYFLSLSGGVGTAPSVSGFVYQEVGVAINSSTILVNFGPAIVL